MPVPRLTAVALYVESVRRSAAFYHNALSAADLVEATPIGDYAVLRLGVSNCTSTTSPRTARNCICPTVTANSRGPARRCTCTCPT
ncbi:MAG: hypothetical protein HZY76_22270 [Anaerolineae bacterium]|nr:MAG: hypothetical protein HZY76_22270 [Anaerolineae bacterium]